MGGGSSTEAAPIIVTPAKLTGTGRGAGVDVDRPIPAGTDAHVEYIFVWHYRLAGDGDGDGDCAAWTAFTPPDQTRLEAAHRAKMFGGVSSSAASPAKEVQPVTVLLGRTAWNVHLAAALEGTTNAFAMTRGSGHSGVVERRRQEKPDAHAPSPFDELGAGPARGGGGGRADSSGGSGGAGTAPYSIVLQTTVKAHHSLVYCIDFSRDGNRVLSGSRDGSLRYWELESSRVVVDYAPVAGVVLACALSPNGRLAVCGSSNTCAYVLPTERRRGNDSGFERPLATLDGHSHKVYGVKFTMDSRTLVTGSMDCLLKTWDVSRVLPAAPGGDAAQPSETRTIAAHTGPVFTISVSKLAPHLVLSGGDDNLLMSHDLRQPCAKPACTFRGHKATIWTSDIRCDERQYLSGGMDGTVLLWDPRRPSRPLQQLADHGAYPVHCAEFMPEGGMVISSARDSTVRLWDMHPSVARNPHGDAADALGNSNNGSGNNNGSGSRTVSSAAESGGSVGDGDGAAATTGPGAAEALPTMELGRVTAHSGNVFKVACDPIHNRVMSCGSDGLVKIWKLQQN